MAEKDEGSLKRGSEGGRFSGFQNGLCELESPQVSLRRLETDCC